MRLSLALAAALLASPIAAQMSQDPNPRPSPKPTRVVARSGRLVTARTTSGGTQSFNCNRPENAKRSVCKGTGDNAAVKPK